MFVNVCLFFVVVVFCLICLLFVFCLLVCLFCCLSFSQFLAVPNNSTEVQHSVVIIAGLLFLLFKPFAVDA